MIETALLIHMLLPIFNMATVLQLLPPLIILPSWRPVTSAFCTLVGATEPSGIKTVPTRLTLDCKTIVQHPYHH